MAASVPCTLCASLLEISLQRVSQFDVLFAKLERFERPRDLPAGPRWHLLDLDLVARRSNVGPTAAVKRFVKL